MRLSFKVLTLALTAVPLVASAPALAAAPGPVTVARYSFDGSSTAARLADKSGRGSALKIRTADRGRVNFNGATSDKYVAFPGTCVKDASACPRALLEGTDDPDLDPGTRLFRWGVKLRLTKKQVAGSSNVVQKGVIDTESQWKLQIGANQGKAHCVIVGQKSSEIFLIRSTVGVADNKWHEIMCQRSGTRLTVYVDGRDRGHLTVPATLSIANDKPLRIGGPNFNTKSDMYHGLLDNVYARLG